MKQDHKVNENGGEFSLDETQPGCSYKMSDRVPAESSKNWKKNMSRRYEEKS